MSSSMSDVDRELLGEATNDNGAEATMAKANGGIDNGALEGSRGVEFTPLNATAGTLIKVNRNGDEVEAGNAKQDTTVEDTEVVAKTPVKRGAAAAANDESSQPSKKRSPVKKNATTTNGDATESATSAKKRASAKKKSAADVNTNTGNGETDGETEGLEPVTPKKGKRATGKAKATKADNDIDNNSGSAESNDKSTSRTKGNGEVEGMTVLNTPRKRQASKKELAAPRGIPTSWDDADGADRMLVIMKEKGEGWNEIRATWKQMTGQDTASSTLPNRYNRIKVNMMRMKEGDEKHLLAAKKDIEDAYNASFWANVAANMERRGADKYPAAFVQKIYKELEVAGKADINATNDAASSSSSTATGAVASVSKDTKGTKVANGAKGTKGIKEDVDMEENDVDVKEEGTENGDDP